VTRFHLDAHPLIVGCLLLLACALQFAGPAEAFAQTDDPSVGDPQAVDVLLTEYAFTPAEIAVAPGAVRLRIVNAGIRRHNLVVLVAGEEHASPHLRPGEATEWQLQVDQPGRYHVWCNEYVHLEKGMVAVLVVG
jgi:plastocyanin